jgi:hypothetical protein
VLQENIPKTFNRVFFVNSLFLMTLVFVISNIDINANSRESFEQLATVAPLTIVIASLFLNLKFDSHPRLPSLLDFLIGIVVIAEILAFVAVRRPFGAIPNGWSGFGRGYAIALVVWLVIILLTPLLKSKQIYSPWIDSIAKRALGSVCFLIAVMYVPSLIQSPIGFTNFGDTTYFVLEESLAQSAGYIPYVNYTPIYTSLLGWPIALAKIVGLHSGQLLWLTVFLINAIILWAVVKSASILKKVMPNVHYGFIYLCILSILLISGSNSGEYALTSGLAYIPARLFFPIAMFHFLQMTINEIDGKKSSIQLGIVIAFGLIEPPGISLIAGAVALFVLLVLSRGSIEIKKKLFYVVMSITGSVSAYLLAIASFFGRSDLTRYLFMIKAVAKSENSKNYQTSMPIFGFHVVVLSCLVASTFVGLHVLLNTLRKNKDDISESMVSGPLCAAFFGLLGLIWSLQFSKASVYPFILQFLLFWTMLSMWGFISLIHKGHWMTYTRSLRLTKTKRDLLAISLLAVLPVLSVAQMPNPINEVRRLVGIKTSEYDRWTESSLKENARGKMIQSLLIKYSDKSIGYFGTLGNSMEVIFGVENYLGITSPESLFVNSIGGRLGCEPLTTNPPEILIVAWTAFPCIGYTLIEDHQEGFVRVYSRTR